MTVPPSHWAVSGQKRLSSRSFSEACLQQRKSVTTKGRSRSFAIWLGKNPFQAGVLTSSPFSARGLVSTLVSVNVEEENSGFDQESSDRQKGDATQEGTPPKDAPDQWQFVVDLLLNCC